MLSEIRLVGTDIFVEGKKFALNGYEPRSEIGLGANGIVFKVRNLILNRDEALKIWDAKRIRDDRDKRIQGFQEINSQARARGHTPVVYSAGEKCDRFYALMEFIPGPTLKEWLQSDNRTLLRSLSIGEEYAFIAQQYGEGDLIHGDPHWKNVILGGARGITLLDFGTSFFSDRQVSLQRHWAIVAETFAKLIHPFPFFELIKTREFEGIEIDDIALYVGFKDMVEEWLLYLGIIPPARGVNINYYRRTSKDAAVSNEVKAILDKVPTEQLLRQEFLGQYWHY